MKLQQLAIAHLVLCAAVLLWDLWVAGRAAQLRSAPPLLVAISGLAGLLLSGAAVVPSVGSKIERAIAPLVSLLAPNLGVTALSADAISRK